jgi:hypothetical protein
VPHLPAPLIISRARQAAFAVTIATAIMLAAIGANHFMPARGLVPRALGSTTDWNGWIAGVPDGTYTLSVPPGRGAQIAIDGRVVFDGLTATPIRLDTAPHAFDFQRPGAPAEFDVQASRDGARPETLPSSVLYERRPSTLQVTLAPRLERMVVVAKWLWVLTLIGAAVSIALAVWKVRRISIAAQVDWRALRWIVLVSFALNAIPVWWGLPAMWAPDELSPGTVLRALAEHFAHGWFDRWPPLHYYVLTATMSPALLLDALGVIDFGSVRWAVITTLIGRGVSLAAAAGTLVAVALVASRVFGRRAGLFAVAIFALAVPFPYYAKTANLDVPYVFWFAVSLVFYLRMLEAPRPRDAASFAACATLAVCTKDQAYALYPLMGLAIAVRVWQARRQAGLSPWLVLFDTSIVTGVTTAVMVFVACHNLFFNWSGFVEHVRYITGPGNENYRMFSSTIGGRVDLLRLTAGLIRNSWGWPMTVVCACGVAIAASRPAWRAPAMLLVAPAFSYYLTFVNVILYNYDRFVLPMTLILSMFGGVAVAALLSWEAVPRWSRVGVVTALFAYTVLYSATLDALMLRDSRIVVTRWAAERLQPGEQIAISGPRELEPEFTVPWLDVSTRDDLERARPAYYVLSADYARAAPRDSEWGQLIAALQSGAAGYRLMARVRCPSPWPWLPDAHPELVGPRPVAAGGSASSVLRDINPTLEIYTRGGRTAGTVACATPLIP